MAAIYAPNGTRVVWGGWNINPVGGCTDIERVPMTHGPETEHDRQRLLHLHPALGTMDLLVQELDQTIQNAWTGSSVATYDLDIIFNGICEGDCFDLWHATRA